MKKSLSVMEVAPTAMAPSPTPGKIYLRKDKLHSAIYDGLVTYIHTCIIKYDILTRYFLVQAKWCDRLERERRTCEGDSRSNYQVRVYLPR